MEKECVICTKKIKIKPSQINKRHTCSRECFKIYRSKNYSGENHPRWKGGIEIHNAGYILSYKPSHPKSHKGKVLLHRIIAEKIIGRELSKDEIVHHINGNKKDNRIQNLKIISRAEHMNLHREKLRKKV